MSAEYIRLRLSEATVEQLRSALAESLRLVERMREQGSVLHTHGVRVDALRAELQRRCAGVRE
jgi:hypothetical protein